MLLCSLMVNRIRAQIEKSLVKFMDQVGRDYNFNLVHPKLYQSIREYNLRKGKRLRPLLLILTYKGYSKKGAKTHPSVFYASTCIELLHNFMLIHDDIIDCSDLRRGKPTMHIILRNILKTNNPKKLGSDLAIIAGDIVYALAIDAFLSVKEDPVRKERALKYFIQTAAFTAMGEFIDTLHGVDKIDNVKENDVYLNYTLKTARYTFDCPMVTGAILAGAPEKDIKKISELGIMVGQAFQIQDDIIGIFDSEKNIGKSILSDLAESKKTLLVAHAFKTIKGNSRKQFLAIFNKEKKVFADLRAIRKLFIGAGSLDYCLLEVAARVEKTVKILDKLTMQPKYKNIIRDSIFTLFQHTNRIAKENNIPTNLDKII